MDGSAFRDNRGLTLVELLLGVVILAIVIVPLLHSFIVGAGTEKKSRDYGNATGAAQNLAEQIQANDANLVLNDAEIVASGAKFYTFNGTSYFSHSSQAAPMPDGTDKTYYLGIQNYSYGSTAYDALVTLTLDADNAVNKTDVSISNQMGAYLDMTAADTDAETALKTECGSLVNPDTLTKDMLTRSITFNITKITGATTDSYKIDVLFSYTCIISYTVNNEHQSTSFSYTDTSSANVASIPRTNDKSAVFSVYMFFDGYYRSTIQNETVNINNLTGSDVNIFLVNTSTNSMPSTYHALIWYKYQNFNGDNPVNNLVFTNLFKDRITYRASKNELLRKTLSVTGYLVEENKLDRLFAVNIKLFKSGTGFLGVPVLDIDTTKLN